MFWIASNHWARRLAFVVTVATSIASFTAPVSADLKDETSLGFAPADTSFYVSGMLMREVYDKVMASNAIAKLKSVPAVQFGLAMAMQQWNNPQDPQLAAFKEMLSDPANQQLVELLKDAVSHEVFIYGDKNAATTVALLNEINTAATEGQMEALSAGDILNMQNYQTRKIVEVLNKQGDNLKFPTILTGMKLSDTQRALDQLQRLEALVQGMLQQQPALQPRFSREQIGGGEFLTLKLDGSLVPWPMILQNAEGVDQQVMQQLVEKLTPLELVVSIGVNKGYLLISLGADNAHLGQLGQGSLLIDREELTPVRAAAGKPITEIAYVSGEFIASVATVERQMDQLVAMVKQFAPMFLSATPELQEELIADVQRFAAYVKENVPQPGAYAAYNYLTPEGYESYSYNYASESALDASQNLSILNHVGGNPIAFYAARGKSDPTQLDDFGVFFSRLGYYGEQIAMQQLRPDQVDQYQKAKAEFLPLLTRFGQVTRDTMVPAFADGQSALVLDAKLKSKAWHVMMPPPQEELPMLEMGVVMGVSDADKVKQGFSEYFEIAQEALDKLHELSTGDLRDVFPNPVPPIKLAKPATEDVEGGTVYYYALPAESGLDRNIAPNAGLSDTILASSLLPRFTARMLADTPLEGQGPLANVDRPLAAAFQLNFAELLTAIRPWVDYGLTLSMSVSTTQPGMDPMGNIPQQVHDVMEVLSCFRGVSGVTYQEGNAMVTHAQWRFEDLQ